jgi:predicted lipoprotein with Yx(FWY)xxD motif
MTEYHVVPSGNQWRVQHAGGSVVSNHRKKSPAVSKAKGEAGSGDSVIIHRSDGTVQDRRSY